MTKDVIDEGLKMKDIKSDIMSYVKKRMPIYKTWSSKELQKYISFFISLNQLIISQDSEGKINGILGMRFLNDSDNPKKLTNNFNGEGVLIELFSADNKEVRKSLVQQAITGSGIRKWISFERFKYDERMKKMPWSFAERMASYG